MLTLFLVLLSEFAYSYLSDYRIKVSEHGPVQEVLSWTDVLRSGKRRC